MGSIALCENVQDRPKHNSSRYSFAKTSSHSPVFEKYGLNSLAWHSGPSTDQPVLFQRRLGVPALSIAPGRPYTYLPQLCLHTIHFSYTHCTLFLHPQPPYSPGTVNPDPSARPGFTQTIQDFSSAAFLNLSAPWLPCFLGNWPSLNTPL